MLLQRRGQLVHETRFDLLLDPQRFLADAWDFWFGREDFGRVQNQRFGYFFPMGPFMVLGDVLGLTPWVTERLWMAFLLVLAWWGVARLADELRIGTPATRVLGAAAYALSPFFVGRTGAISVFVQGGALLPWILVPLVRASRAGSPRRGACRSAVAILLIGGTNASVTFSVLVVPVLWLLTRSPGPRRRALAGWWIAAAIGAMAWWMVPLALQSRYGTDFFPISEQASVTTLVTGPFDVLRGAADWVGHLRFFGEPHLLSASIVATSELVIIASGLLAAAGLAGLALRSLPEARFLRLALLVGIAVVGSAHGGLLGNPASDLVLDLLESGPLAAFRTLYKAQPIVLLPLALGLAHLVARVPLRLPESRRIIGALAALAAVAIVIVLGAQPLLTQEFVGSEDEAFSEVPSWWVEAGEHIDATDGRALLVPGMPKATSTWGLTDEEPLAWLTNQPWATRNQVPFGTYSSTRALDTVESAIAQGGDPGLPTYLERAGIFEVVARNDARWQLVDAPSPRDVHDALTNSGLRPTASFGPELAVDATGGATGLHAIDIYAVPGAAERRVRFYPASSAAVVSGDSTSVLTLARWGLADRALVFADDLRSGERVPRNWIITDDNQRRATSFGRTRENLGYVLGRHDRDPNEDTAVDARFYPDQSINDQTVSTYGDVRSVSASTYGATVVPLPRFAPVKAIDGDRDTSWVPGTASQIGQWLELELADTRELDDVAVVLREQLPPSSGTISISATTDAGTRTTELDASSTEPQVLEIPSGRTKRLRLIIEDIDASDARVGISEVISPSFDTEQRLRVPDQLADRFAKPGRALPIYVFTRYPADASATDPLDVERDLRRRFVVPRAGTFGVEAEVLGQPSREVLEVLGTTATMKVEASTTAGNLPRYAPRNLIDGDPVSYWTAQYPDRNGPMEQSISLQWLEPRSVDTIMLTGVPGHRFPDRIRVADGAGVVREAPIDANGTGSFEPLVTDRVTIDLVSESDRIVGDTPVAAFTNPFALAEVDIPAVRDLLPGPPNRAQPVDVACADGPTVTVGADTRTFAVHGTVDDLYALRPLRAEPCEPAPISLRAGTHDLDTAANGSPFTIDSVRLASDAALRAPAPRRSVSVEEWKPSTRTIEVTGPGAGYLDLTHNANEGWAAEVDGQELEPAILEGWQQAFFMPADTSGTVTVDFGPNGTYRLALVVGACLALVVVAGALLRGRDDSRAPVPTRPWSRTWAWAVGGVLAVVIAGLAALLVLPLVYVARRRRTALAPIAAGAGALAAIIAASTQGETAALGPEGDVVTILVLLGIAALVAAFVNDDEREHQTP